MKLNEKAFYLIKESKKIIEGRLYDEKRKQIEIGDTIIFSKLPDLNEKIETKVSALLIYKTFKELIQDLPITYFGYPKDTNKEEFAESYYKIYTLEKEKQYGVLGIKLSPTQQQTSSL